MRRPLLLIVLVVVLLPAARGGINFGRASAQTSVDLTLSPDSGAAGTTVTISGFVAGVSATDAAAPDFVASHVDVCWHACPGGLAFQQQAVSWSTDDPGAFSVAFTVPAVPWLEADGVQQLTPGSYAVGLQCLTPPGTQLVRGCALNPAVATATFTLSGPAPAACGNDACADLVLTPSEAPPGALVQVSGNAPLAQNVSDSGACCWNLVAQGDGVNTAPLASLHQALDGSLSGSFRVPLSLASDGSPASGGYTLALQTSLTLNTLAKGPTSVNGDVTLLSTPSITIVMRHGAIADATLAPTSFIVDAAPVWSELSLGAPELIQPSTPLVGAVVSADDSVPTRVAACVAGAVLVSDDGGANWQPLPTAGAAAAITASGYAPFPADTGGGPACLSATLDPANPDAIFATFAAASVQFGAPPIFRIALSSSDGGADWQTVPPPAPATPAGFGGFFSGAAGIEALFSAPSTTAAATATPIVESSVDGGQSWTPSGLECPGAGPCVRWGAAANATGSCAMHGYPQPLLVSEDGGASFAAPEWPGGANGCDANELVSFDPSTVLLLSGLDPFPAVLSHDAGQSWQAIALPPIPDEKSGAAQFPGLQALPSGALLAHGSGWQLLPPGADAWCAVDEALLPTTVNSVSLAAGRLWWYDNGGTTAAAPSSVDAASVNCAGN